MPEASRSATRTAPSWPKADPEVKCYLPGIPRATYMPYPFQIIQGGGDILFATNTTAPTAIVFMSDHQEPPVDTWMGWSNGHWEDDTLVIETTGFNDKTWFDRAGNYHSGSMKVTERLRSKARIRYRYYEATIDDPEVFSRPWTISMPLYRHLEPNAEILEFKCVPFVEELLYKDLEQSQ